MENGVIVYQYELYVRPCPCCGGTSITLFEEAQPPYGRKSLKGGGTCKLCGHTKAKSPIPSVPSVNMLLDIWNEL